MSAPTPTTDIRAHCAIGRKVPVAEVRIARLPAHYIRDIDRRGNEPEILEGVGDPLLFCDDPAVDPQDAEAPVGKGNLHHWFGKPGSGAERLGGAPNILCRIGV